LQVKRETEKGMEKSVLRDEFQNVMKSYGIDESRVSIFNHPVRSLHASRQEILEEMIRERNNLRPDVVIGPSLNDFHQDHQIVANEMIRSFKSSASILCYELPWNHISFDTQLFIRLERRHIEKKMKVLEEYKSQIVQNKPYFCKEFTTGLARTRGVQSNSEYAEAFEVIRWRI
jgi:LmbE family N-acetylglucosaminyl deacetylase